VCGCTVQEVCILYVPQCSMNRRFNVIAAFCMGQMASVPCCHEHRHNNGPLRAAPAVQVLVCVVREERAAAAGLWHPKPSHLSIAACMGQLHDIATIARGHIGESLHCRCSYVRTVQGHAQHDMERIPLYVTLRRFMA
jgi:hypothetical protein